MDFNGVEKHILTKLDHELPADLFYHDAAHTRSVIAAVRTIAAAENIAGLDLTRLLTAALFHDTGFLFEYSDNEPAAADMARRTLPAYGYSPRNVALVVGMVLATKMPQAPETSLQEVICDADLFYLGTDEYHRRAELYRRELAVRNILFSDAEWRKCQCDFLNNHSYFTRFARRELDPVKQLHLREISGGRNG